MRRLETAPSLPCGPTTDGTTSPPEARGAREMAFTAHDERDPTHPGRGFYRDNHGIWCKACGGMAKTSEVPGVGHVCSDERCPNSEMEHGELLVKAAATEMMQRARMLSTHCAMLCDGLEAFRLWDPPEGVVEDVEEARSKLLSVVQKIYSSFQKKEQSAMWTTEALTAMASKKPEEP